MFLDNDLVDFCQRLPNRFKFCNGERKYLLKRVTGRLPPRPRIEAVRIADMSSSSAWFHARRHRDQDTLKHGKVGANFADEAGRVANMLDDVERRIVPVRMRISIGRSRAWMPVSTNSSRLGRAGLWDARVHAAAVNAGAAQIIDP